jgi:lysophospholipase L1-like esterase
MRISKGRALFVTYLASVLLPVLAAEAWVRLRSPYGYITPESLRMASLRYTPAVFARHVFPRQVVEAQPGAGRKDLRYFINRKGYRGRDFETQKPVDSVRTIVYGGSAVFDQYVTEPSDWPHRVETLLRDAGLKQVEVINAGIPGHASSDSLGRLFAEGHGFDPDIVVLYEGWNDLKFLASSEPLLRQAVPYGEFEDPRLVYRNIVDRWLCEASQLYVRLRYRYYEYRLRATLEGARPTTQGASVSAEAVKQYRLTIETFVDVARRSGAIPVLMTQARLVRGDNTEEERRRIGYDMQPLSAENLPTAFRILDETLFAVSVENGVDLIDAASLIRTSSDFVDHVHLSREGSARLAQVTAEALRPIIERVRLKHMKGASPRVTPSGPGQQTHGKRNNSIAAPSPQAMSPQKPA